MKIIHRYELENGKVIPVIEDKDAGGYVFFLNSACISATQIDGSSLLLTNTEIPTTR